MANTLEYEITSIDSEITEAVVTDNTTYSSPTRSNVRNYVKVEKLNNDLSVYATPVVTGNNSDPESDTSYTFPLSRDGFYRLRAVSLTLYAGGTTYALYDAVADSSTDIVYRSKQAGNL